jgi:hypothetical protein
VFATGVAEACSGEGALVFLSSGLENAGMFLRKNRKRFDGEVYEYWTLCESVRTDRGPRQRVVASLGKFTEEDFSAGWEDLEALLDGRTPAPKEGDLFNGTPKAAEGLGWELADLKNLGVERVREYGSVFLVLALWRRLGLHELLGELIEPGREEIAWADVVAVLTMGKRWCRCWTRRATLTCCICRIPPRGKRCWIASPANG